VCETAASLTPILILSIMRMFPTPDTGTTCHEEDGT
jgi:hypothetical protein